MVKTDRKEIFSRLIKAFDKQNVKEFSFLFDNYSISSDESLQSIGIDRSIIEYVLERPNCPGFIRLCLQNSSMLWKKNAKGHYLINYAIKSLCAENINILVNHLKSSEAKFYNKMILMCEISGENNYLHDVIEEIDNKNQGECRRVLEMLLSYGCNPNHLNDASKSPFELLLFKINGLTEGKKLIEVFRDADVEIADEYKRVAIEFNQKFRVRGDCEVNSHYLAELINQGNEKMFISGLERVDCAEFPIKLSQLLKSAIEMDFYQSISILVRHAMTLHLPINPIDGNKKPLLSYAVSLCRHRILEKLLKFEEISFNYYTADRQNILHEICALTDIDSYEDFKECFDLIIQDPRCTTSMLNALDSKQKTPLMYASENNHKSLVRELMQRGAYIGHDTIINNLTANVLEEQLDELIIAPHDLDDHNCTVQMNLNCLIPPKGSSKRDMETEALFLIASQPRFKKILTHPVIVSFIELKWKRVNLLMYAALLLYFFFFLYLSIFFLYMFQSNMDCMKMEVSNTTIKPIMDIGNGSTAASIKPVSTRVDNRMNEDVPTMPNISVKYDVPEHSDVPENSDEADDQPLRNFKVLKRIFGRKKREASMPVQKKICDPLSYIDDNPINFKVATIGTFILTIVEIVQFAFTWRHYFLKLSNWVDCTFLGLAYVVIFKSFGSDDSLRQMRAVLFIVIASQSFILLSRISKLSMHLEIFKKVCKTFMKFLMLYFMLLLAFAMAFYTLYGDVAKKKEEPEDKKDDDKENPFENVLMSLITVVRMMLSDFEGIDLKPDDRFNAIVFLTFVLLITIILFNLLNALAIADTQQIMKSAEIVDVKKRIKMTRTCERILGYLKIDTFNVYAGQIPSGKIFLKVNVDNFVRIKKAEDYSENSRQNSLKLYIHNGTSKKSDNIELGIIESGSDSFLNKSASHFSDFFGLRNLKLSKTTIAKIVEHVRGSENFN